MPRPIRGMKRPVYHFTPTRNWMNDPNGPVFHDGLWHLYFQYNPLGDAWGNMSWGHATSTDLRHWAEHPVALRFRRGEQIYSGSVVSTGGAASGPLTALYTSAYDDGHQAQSRATSADGGFTWEPDRNNPVLDRGTPSFRDPKLVRMSEGDERWWLLATVEADERQVLFYKSTDLREWEHLSTFGPLGHDQVVWECPDLIRMTVDGNPDDERWLLILSTNPIGPDPDPDGSSMSYLVGRFDGRTFEPDTPGLIRLDHGRDLYAGTTFYDAPGGDPVMIAWMNNWRYADVLPTSPWRGAMSLPRRLRLTRAEGEIRLMQTPCDFVQAQLCRIGPAAHGDDDAPAPLPASEHMLLELCWDPRETGTLDLAIRDAAGATVTISHQAESNELRVARADEFARAVHPDFPSTSVGRPDWTDGARMLISLDGPLLEVFAGDGDVVISNLVPFGPGTVTAALATGAPGLVAVSFANLGDS